MKLRVLTYNIRHGQGIDNKISLERIAWVIYNSRADICGLQELDKWNPRSGMRNQAKELARLCGMNYVFGANISLAGIARYGNAILSRWPILNHRNYSLPGKGEKRGLLKAVIKRQNLDINFYNTHLTLDENSRIEQVQFINSVINQQDPTILTGDLNEQIGGKALKSLQDKFINCFPNDTGAFTYPTASPTEKIDYIFTDKEWRVNWAKVIKSQASDHLPFLAEVVHK
ncbi:MAG: endonuclease [Firmicutes bacterium]|nr:endonuclease [Bacillota bacterium]